MRRVVKDGWTATYPRALAVRTADPLVSVGRQNLWDGHTWVWVRGQDGHEGWLPDALVARVGDGWRATGDFDAMELTCAAREVVEVLGATHGWTLCRAADGRRGWVPDRNLGVEQPG